MTPSPDEPKASILIVDDEQSLLDICNDALTEAGYSVQIAHNADAALRKLEFLPKTDLVITDLRMPGISGLDLMKKIKEGASEADFLIMTGFGSIETAVESIRLGAADYLPKPFNISHLLLKVERILQIRQDRADRRKLSNVVKILNLSHAMNTKLDMKSLTNEFLSQIQKNFTPDGIVLFLQESSGLQSKAMRGALMRGNPQLVSWVKHLGERVFRQQLPELLLVKAKSPNQISPEGPPPCSTISSIMVAPMTIRMKSIGVVVLLRNASKPDYSREDSQLLNVFAAHTASAFENARLYGQLWDMNLEVIRSFAQAVEAKDVYTRGHSERVALYATHLGSRLGLSRDELHLLYTGGILHDIGKIGIPDVILNKPAKLTSDEFVVMQRHPELGRAILNQVTSFSNILPIIFYHHERMDGQGYPMGLSGDDIPFLARILSVVDSFEAMTSDRAYRKALPLHVVQDIMRQGAGNQWDEELVKVWLDEIEKPEFKNLQQVNGGAEMDFPSAATTT